MPHYILSKGPLVKTIAFRTGKKYVQVDFHVKGLKSRGFTMPYLCAVKKLCVLCSMRRYKYLWSNEGSVNPGRPLITCRLLYSSLDVWILNAFRQKHT